MDPAAEPSNPKAPGRARSEFEYIAQLKEDTPLLSGLVTREVTPVNRSGRAHVRPEVARVSLLLWAQHGEAAEISRLSSPAFKLAGG